MNANPELLEIFRDEVSDTLDALAQCLEGLRAPSGEHAAGVDTAFRHAHNLKGAARMVGQDTVVAVTHTMEDVLSGYRDSGEAPAPALVAAMLEALTVIERAVDGAESSAAAQTVIDRMRAGGGSADPVQSGANGAAHPAAEPAPAVETVEGMQRWGLP